MNPIGFECENQVLNIKEVEFVEQVRCYKTTEEVCSMVKLETVMKKMTLAKKYAHDKNPQF